jgi:light-independent protochlorophyllide reductase subunit B
MGAAAADLARLGEADANVVLYPEVGLTTASWLKRTFRQPMITTVPMGVGATRDFVRETCQVLGLDVEPALAKVESRLPWYSRSVDSTYLTGKRVFIFGDATHAVAAARIAHEEMGFQVVGLGTYVREFAREIRTAAKLYDVEPLITDDYLEVERAIQAAAPEMVLGTQMERHIAKRLGIFCAVISAPVHVQDFPARYSPVMGPEGANVIFDTWVHPLVMGLEEHLLGMFQDDFEFGNGARPSHLHSVHPEGEGKVTPPPPEAPPAPAPEPLVAAVAGNPVETATALAADGPLAWLPPAEKELGKIPFFVRGKVRKNTERFARERGLPEISLETLYDAKAHYGR